ncbi:transketolase [Streptacidiphilus sp. MAP12-20]|uniref:transketolase family protein n=1 Tax=Streptacidiphilus sp. MAP12-20 TaxID=3156299 RepID=UPI003510EF00
MPEYAISAEPIAPPRAPTSTSTRMPRGMRPVIAEALAELGDIHHELVVLAADGRALALAFAERHPDRFIDVGIAEANLMGVAAGLARGGHRVVVCGMAPFLVRRAAEQLRLDLCRPGLDVTVLGVGGGVGYGTLGATHHVPEDLGTLAQMPGTRVFCPADVHDAAWAVREAVLGGGPAYVRLGAREDPQVYDLETRFSAQRPLLLGDPDTGAPGQALVVTAGATVAGALDAVAAVGPLGVSARVLALTAVSPFPRAALLDAAARADTVVTVEEHYAAAGLGAQTALSLAGHWRGRFRALAIDDRPAPVLDRTGLFRFYRIDSAAIVSALLDPNPLTE